MIQQRQDSLTEQLWTVKRLAIEHGCYDAADFIDAEIAKRPPYVPHNSDPKWFGNQPEMLREDNR